MDFKFSAGVGGESGSPECVDEHDGCPTEAYILCAFDQIGSSQRNRMDFLACMDEGDGEPAGRAMQCSSVQNLDFSAMSDCATGSQGVEFLQQAHEYYESNKDHVRGFPTLLIDGQEPWTRDMQTVMKAICSAGVQCACGSVPTPIPVPLPSPSPFPLPSPSPLPVPMPPMPKPSPMPTPTPGRTHYGKPPCQSNEQVIHAGDGASVCAPMCSGTSDSCPRDSPGGKGGLYGRPTCGEGSLATYCVLTCFDQSDCATDQGYTCHSVPDGSLGICAVAQAWI